MQLNQFVQQKKKDNIELEAKAKTSDPSTTDIGICSSIE